MFSSLSPSHTIDSKKRKTTLVILIVEMQTKMPRGRFENAKEKNLAREFTC